MRFLALLLSGLLLVGCSQQQMLQKFSTPADQAVAKGYLADLQAGKFDAIENHIDPKLKTPALHGMLVRMAGVFPAGPPSSVKLIGAQKLFSPAGVRTNTNFEYQWGDKWLLSKVAIQRSGTVETIVGINVYPQKTSLEDQVRFRLSGKSPVQYAILVGAVLAIGLTAWALVACIRTKGLRRKWLWIVFIAVGFGGLSTNWTTGALNFQLIYVSLFSASALAQFYGPWMITVSAPVGAILFLLRRYKKNSSAKPAPPLSLDS